MRRPVLSLVAAVALLLLPAALRARPEALGPGRPDRFRTECPSKEGFVALEQEFGVGTTDSVEIAVEGDVAVPPARAGGQRASSASRNEPALPRRRGRGQPGPRLALVEALVVGDSRDQGALDAVAGLA